MDTFPFCLVQLCLSCIYINPFLLAIFVGDVWFTHIRAVAVLYTENRGRKSERNKRRRFCFWARVPMILLFYFQREKEQDDKERDEAQLMEFVRVRQNLRKIHSAVQNKAANC